MSAPGANAWGDAAPLLTRLQRATAGGGILVVKIDNERTNGKVFTVVVSGPKYGERYFHDDGADLSGILRAALAFCGEYQSNGLSSDAGGVENHTGFSGPM